MIKNPPERVRNTPKHNPTARSLLLGREVPPATLRDFVTGQPLPDRWDYVFKRSLAARMAWAHQCHWPLLRKVGLKAGIPVTDSATLGQAVAKLKPAKPTLGQLIAQARVALAKFPPPPTAKRVDQPSKPAKPTEAIDPDEALLRQMEAMSPNEGAQFWLQNREAITRAQRRRQYAEAGIKTTVV